MAGREACNGLVYPDRDKRKKRKENEKSPFVGADGEVVVCVCHKLWVPK